MEGEVSKEPPTRPVYLLGESFGGVLALAVAHERPDLADRLVLVNPATSFPRSVWPVLGPLLPSVPTVRHRDSVGGCGNLSPGDMMMMIC